MFGFISLIVIIILAYAIEKQILQRYISSMLKKSKDRLEKIKAWRQENISPLWKEAPFYKKIYVWIAVFIGAILLVLFVSLSVQLFAMLFHISDFKRSDINSNFALAFLGTISGVVALFTGFIAILRSEENKIQTKAAEDQSKSAKKQANIAEQGSITDRLNKAVEGLGKRDGKNLVLEVRLGSLYALERIAQDSLRDHISIMEILCAYVRTNSPRKNKTNDKNKATEDKQTDKKDSENKPREDIQTALTIIGRRKSWLNGMQRIKQEEDQEYRLDLSRCDLRNAQLNNATLNHAKFNNTDLTDANLYDTELRRTQFLSAKLIGVNLKGTKLAGAWFETTDVTDMRINNAETIGVFAYEGDLSTCQTFSQEQLNSMYCGIDIDIPKMDGNKKITRPGHWPKKGEYNTFPDFLKAYNKWLKETRKAGERQLEKIKKLKEAQSP